MEYGLQQQTCIKKNEDQIKIVFSMTNAYVYSKINIEINFWFEIISVLYCLGNSISSYTHLNAPYDKNQFNHLTGL